MANERPCINPRLVNELRHAGRPVPEPVLLGLYTDAGAFRRDVGLLRSKGIVRQTIGGLAWVGS